ncbi:cytochrome P450 [Constrictibacter sp. MBR-5]|uniref:hypothetical protein n=1 Tax=Constrictibacter sp. MBR-5 TaxID=3156467 RepID=UPI00339A06D2
MIPWKVLTLDKKAFSASIEDASAAQLADYADTDFLASEDGADVVAWSSAAARAVLDEQGLANAHGLHTAQESSLPSAPQAAAVMAEIDRSVPVFLEGAAHTHFRRLAIERYRAYAADMKAHAAPCVAALVADLDRSRPAADRRWHINTHCNRIFVQAAGLKETDLPLVLSLRDQMVTVDGRLRLRSSLHFQMSSVSLFGHMRRRRSGGGVRAGSFLAAAHVTDAPDDEDAMILSQAVSLFVALNELVPEALLLIDDRLHAERAMWPALAAGSVRITHFVDEALRLAFRSSTVIARRVPEARTVAGCPFAAGTRIIVNIAAASVDRRVMDAGTGFRPGPQSAYHLMFGARRRHCLGRWFVAWLGRRLVAERLRQAGVACAGAGL